MFGHSWNAVLLNLYCTAVDLHVRCGALQRELDLLRAAVVVQLREEAPGALRLVAVPARARKRPPAISFRVRLEGNCFESVFTCALLEPPWDIS